eukprot:jgi/Tetstr1/440852/TSEL_003092.t1
MAEGATDSIACSAPVTSLVQPSNTAFNSRGRKPQNPRQKKDTPPKIRLRRNARTSPRLILAEAEPASPDGTARPMVCKEAWMFIYMVVFLWLRKIRAEVDGLGNPGCSRNAPPVYHIASRIATRAWLKDYFDPKHGRTEKIPNPSSDREEWHFPAWANKAKVYKTYMGDDTYWPSVSIAKKTRDKHRERVTTERLHVEATMLESRRRPDMLSCEIDGMDSSKTLLRHSATWSKDVVKDKFLKVHLACVKHNGMRHDDVYAFTDIFPHDSSCTITVLRLTILKDLERRGYGEGSKPLHKVHFQLDNTCRENKNRCVLCFAEWVVATCVVEEVVLFFLSVGHTHERVDQVFSKFSRRLGGHSAKTLTKLFRKLRQGYTRVCNFEILEGFLDWKEFLGGALPPSG